MFKSAATKIAHNSTLPGLAGNNELRTLQDLIIAEKAVMHSLDRLTNDFAKAVDALRSWGIGEGEDLGDILSSSASLLLHFCNTISHLSSHTQTIRTHMKSIRTREEALLALQRRHRSLQSKCESADKKLSKMSPENKNLQAQMSLINQLREEIREVEGEIMAEEAALGDYKRAQAKEWMGIQFGGLGEVGEVSVLIAYYGKLLIESMPLERTDPGLPRAMYTGHEQTRSIANEADEAIRRVEYTPFPSNSLPSLPISNHSNAAGPADRYSTQTPESSGNAPSTIYAPSPLPPPTHPSALTSSPPPGMPEPSSVRLSDPGFMPPPSHPDTANSGTTQSSSRFAPSGLSSESRTDNWSLEPIQTGGGLGLGDLLGGGGRQGMDEFGVGSGSSAGQAQTVSGPSGSSGGSRGGRFATFPVKGRKNTKDADRDREREREREREKERRSEDAPSVEGLPAYTPMDLNLGSGLQAEPLHLTHDAAANASRDSRAEEDDNVELAYMSPTQESPLPSPMHSRFGAVSEGNDGGAGDSGERGLSVHRADRRIRFKSGATDIDEAMERREEASRVAEAVPEPLPSPHEQASQPPPPPPPPPAQDQPPERMPTPPYPSQREPTDERALNAAAAREISREMDALLFSPPAPGPGQSRGTGPSSPTIGRVPAPNESREGGLLDARQETQSQRAPSPLVPPAPPFAANSPGVGQMNYGEAQKRSLDRERRESSPPVSPRAGQPLPAIPQVPPPPTINLPSRSGSPALSSTTTTPFRTPPEYPRPSYTSLPKPNLSSLSSSNLTTGTGVGSGPSSPLLPPAPGTKTISASAFRRQMRSPSAGSTGSAGMADTSPLNFAKRSLPSSPYPPRGRAGSASSGADRDKAVPVPQKEGEEGLGGGEDLDDQFDYISAYVNEGPDEGQEKQQGRNGYGQGRFATNLEEGELR